MKPALSIDLPPELQEYGSNIEATLKPYVKITARPEKNMRLWQSKFGGTPYLPKDVHYPKGSNDQELFLLAQINFEEVPQLEAFPKTGILQFYIAGNDDLYGMRFGDMTRQENFRILYFSEITKHENDLITNFEFVPKFDDVPLSSPCSLTFELAYEPISVGDYQFENKVLAEKVPESKDELYKIYDAYGELLHAGGHKLGGYPFFTQSDPRAYEKFRNEEYILLLQVDTDDQAAIMWGDAGVGNFFIREKDLRKRDFSQVIYNWDCA